MMPSSGGMSPKAVRHFMSLNAERCLRCGMSRENMVRRGLINRCRGDNRDPQTGRPYPDGAAPRRADTLDEVLLKTTEARP